MTVPQYPRTTVIDPKTGSLRREWVLWFEKLAKFLTDSTGVVSIFGRAGVVTATEGDYSASEITNDSQADGEDVATVLTEHAGLIGEHTDALAKRTWRIETSACTAEPFDKVLADTETTGAFTVDLPAAPAPGCEVQVADATGYFATANCTVDGNGNNINGSATSVLSTNNTHAVFVFNGDEWRKF